MEGATPWLICGSVSLLPLITFALGLYIGRKGLPYEIEIRRRERPEDQVGYGQG